MAWSFSTEAILDELRTAAGSTATDGTTTYTWVGKPEGPVLGILDDTSDYPLLVFTPAITEGTDGVTFTQLDLSVVVTAVIKTSRIRATGAASSNPYELVRLAGEDMASNIMDTGHKLGGSIVQNRALANAGVDHELIEDMEETGLLAYSAEFVLTYQEPEP